MRTLKGNWEETRAKFDLWWKHELKTPLIQCACPSAVKGEPQETDFRTPAELFTKLPDSIIRFENSAQDTAYLFDAVPHYYPNLGPGSLGVFLGAKPHFTPETVWYEPFCREPDAVSLSLENGKSWLDFSLEALRQAKHRANGRYLPAIPDLIEGLDTLAALIGTQELMYALADCPKEIHRLQKQLTGFYQQAYDLHWQIVRDEKDYSVYGAFAIWGKGKTCKIQCDVSAMLSPQMFEEFALPYLEEQCRGLDNIIYHLDGTDAIRHLDAILKIDAISCIQWTPGDGKPDGGDGCWDFLYRKILDSGKNIYGYMPAESGAKFLKKFGTEGVLLSTWAGSEAQAAELFGSYKK